MSNKDQHKAERKLERRRDILKERFISHEILEIDKAVENIISKIGGAGEDALDGDEVDNITEYIRAKLNYEFANW